MDSIPFQERIAAQLSSHDISFEENASFGGIVVDFLVTTPNGRLIGIEAKRWAANINNHGRATRQIDLYQESVGLDKVVFVIEGSGGSRIDGAIVTEGELISVLLNEIRAKDSMPAVALSFDAGRRLKAYLSRQSGTRKKIFAAMPFSADYDDVFLVSMAYAAEYAGVDCQRVDYEDYSGDIVEAIKHLIRQSVVVVADLSEAKPNVLYETGFAHALNLPTIHLCSSPLSELPFDVRNWNTIKYAKGQTYALREVLAKRLVAAVEAKR